MGTEDGANMGFQNRSSGRSLNCPSSGISSNPMTDFSSNWDALVFGGSSMVNPQIGFGNSPYPPVILENQGMPSSSNLVHYPPDSGLVDTVQKIPSFGSGSFSEMVGSFGLPGSDPIATTNGQQVTEEGTMGASSCAKRKKRTPEPSSPFKNGEGEQERDVSGDGSECPKEQDEKKRKTEQNKGANSRNKQMGKQAKDNSNGGEAPKENYIHVRARRGQATNSHSLAERVRRERISERMRLLQELVPGCNKITGKAVMLDEIINYVQSLQQQVEFLSMKLATVNPELNIDIDRILSKEILHSRGAGMPIPGFGPGMSSSHPYAPVIPQGALPGIAGAASFHPMSQNLWDNELQSLLQMGFDSNSAISNLGPNGGRSKLEL
ncbi:hypothetical protein NMG60_11016571 [Bertholletia excelsa]